MINDKNKKRHPYDAYRVAAIQATADKFSVTVTYVRVCINGTVEYGQSAEIKKYFNETLSKIKKVIA